MSLEKSEILETIGETAEAAPMRETAPVIPASREAPRKRYAAPSAPRVLQCMLPADSAERTTRVKA
ncbi:MAG: hypothetical protein WEA77_00595 [Hyphomonas sp.]|uniref:hypothetical protein n=1 Tax=Hyphomonas sp. TaxID=87 RepID=UPI0034A004D0